MAYDATKNVTLVEVELNEGDTVLNASVEQYNGGEPKLQLTRFYVTKAGARRPRKVGRMTVEEVESLAKRLPELMRVLNGETE
jgi:hypothetical protein